MNLIISSHTNKKITIDPTIDYDPIATLQAVKTGQKLSAVVLLTFHIHSGKSHCPI